MSLLVSELISLGEKRLIESGVIDAKLDSKALFCYMLEIPQSRLVLEYQNIMQDRLCERYFDLIDRRGTGEPLQYIVGSVEFMGLKFEVDKSVLIPRQDTETLVEDAIDIISKGSIRGSEISKERKKWAVLDLCTGSGAIGISISKLCDNVKVSCSDISSKAVEVCKKNAENNGLSKRISFNVGNLLEPFVGRFGVTKFDMIISNPPYIPTATIPTLMREVKDNEPISALDGGTDGLDFYREIIENAHRHLNKRGVLMLEIGHDQKSSVESLLKDNGSYDNIRCYKDLPGNDRIMFAEKSLDI